MINYNKICVFDFETDGSDPSICSPVQLAAIMIDPLKLEIIKNSEFNVNLKPERMEKENFKYDDDILNFHAKVRGCEQKDILELWKSYPSQKNSWEMFTEYLQKYHYRSTKQSQFTAPIAAGYNINRFDMVIVDRLCTKYNNLNKEKRQNIFYMRDMIDIMNIIFYWFENNSDLKSYSLDSLRDYLGISKDGAHDAIKDVKDCAEILIRFIRLHRKLSAKISFKNSFINI